MHPRFFRQAGLAAPLLAWAVLNASPGSGFRPGDVAPAQPVIPARTFNLADYGAVSNARTSNTAAFQRAVAAVNQAGGGTLVVPAGIYGTNAFGLCSSLNLHLDAGATILFSPEGTLLADGRTYRPLLSATDAHDVMISGSGTIYGSGEAWWPVAHFNMHHHLGEPQRPHSMVGFDRCQRVRVEGVTLTHAPAFNLVPTRCQDVTIEGVTIYNPADPITPEDGIDPARVRDEMQKQYDDESPNTDGIDPSVSQRVWIDHCRIDTGDDCIAIKADNGGVTSDILVTNCTFLRGHGCSIGSVTRGGLRNMTVRHCLFDGTHLGINLKSNRARGGLVDNLTFEDLTMRNVGEAIVITSYYPQVGPLIYARPYGNKFAASLANGGHDDPQPIVTTPRWRGITIRHITATCVWEAGLILGLPEMPAEQIVLDDVTISAPYGLHLNYAHEVTLHEVHIQAKHGPALISSDNVTDLSQ